MQAKISSFKRDEGSLEALFLRLTKNSELEDLEPEELESKVEYEVLKSSL